MKKIILCAAVMLYSALACANDIIVTRDAKKIEASILLVSSSEVKYKEIDNPNGPTFILKTNEISSIIYQNGKVQLFHTSETQPKEEQVAMVALEQQKPQPQKASTTNDVPNIVRIDHDYFVGDREISQAELKNYYQKYCPQAYAQYKKGKGLIAGGSIIACAVSGATLGWTIAGCLPGSHRSLATTLGVTGALLVVDLGVSLPLIISGQKKANGAYDIYRHCQDKNEADFQMGVSENGLTFAISF